jgi:hypothetical protein
VPQRLAAYIIVDLIFPLLLVGEHAAILSFTTSNFCRNCQTLKPLKILMLFLQECTIPFLFIYRFSCNKKTPSSVVSISIFDDFWLREISMLISIELVAVNW